MLRRDRVHHIAVAVRDREHEDTGQRGDHRDLARRLYAADPGHVQVHHDDVRYDLAYGAQRIGPVVTLTDDLHALVLEQIAEAGAEQIVIVDEQTRVSSVGEVVASSLTSPPTGAR